MASANFLSELKRRQVYRGGVMYVVAGWVIVQVATTLFPIFGIPGWAIRLIVVLLLLGFPLALVALWMFDTSSRQGSQPDPLPTPPVERRRNSDRGNDALVQLMEHERNERQRAHDELIAVFDRLHQLPHDASNPQPGAAHAPPLAPPPAPPASKRPRVGMILVTCFALLLGLWAVWILIAPSVPAEVADGGKLAQQYAIPAYHRVVEAGASLLAPLLRKLGIGIAPDRVFTSLVLIVALLVLRNLYRSMLDAHRRHRRH